MARFSNKFKAKRTIDKDGIAYGSQAEKKYLGQLAILQKAGLITDLVMHPQWQLEVNGKLIGRYTADAAYRDEHGHYIVVDVKSPATARLADYRLRKKLMLAIHDIEITEVY